MVENRYEYDLSSVIQVHPTYGRRSLIDASGHGQLVWVGEVAGSLLILDRWSVMGYKDGSLRVLDPDTLELKVYISLDLDAVWPMGLDEAGRFVLCESKPGWTTWQAWRLVDWGVVRDVEPVPDASIQPLDKVLTCMLDLPRVSRSAS